MLDLGLFSGKGLKLVHQSEVADCGLACLAMCVSHYGGDANLAELRRRFPVSTRGTTLASLIKIADRIGFSARPLSLAVEALPQIRLPVILHWNLSHFVVLSQVRRGKYLLYDPGGLIRWASHSEMSRYFTGVALELTPVSNFAQASQAPKLRMSQLWSHLTGLKRALGQIVFLSLLMQIFLLISPYYFQIAIDTVLPDFDVSLLLVLGIAFGLFAIINATAAFLRSFVLVAAGSQFAFGLSTNLSRKLLRLPLEWFSRRHVGDILSRLTSIIPLRTMLVEGAVTSVLDGLLAVLTLAIMFLYSTTLSIVSLTAFILYFFINQLTFYRQKQAQESFVTASALEQTCIVETLRGISTIRLFQREPMRLSIWQDRMARSLSAAFHVQRVGNWQTLASSIIFGLENVIIVAIGVRSIMTGSLSIGMLFAYMAYKVQFSTAATSLIHQIADFRMLSLHLERLSEIALTPDDDLFLEDHIPHRDLAGLIELRDIRYRYGDDEPWVLNGLSLTVVPGECVAITGVSGGGKSTLVKILLGLIRPQSGEILVDGQNVDAFGRRNLLEQTAGILQDDTLFEGSISSNISMFDPEEDMAAVREAAVMAAIASDIEVMPMRYDTLVGDMGSALSGGQRQRVLIARSLYRKPKLLIIDEGTSHLDLENEVEVNRAISSLGVTRVIIAHRKETIDASDRILVLEDGKLINWDTDPADAECHGSNVET